MNTAGSTTPTCYSDRNTTRQRKGSSRSPVSERELAEDLALTDAELDEVRGYVANHPRLAVQEHLASLLESIIGEAYERGWLRRDPPRSPQEIALKKLAKRRAKLAKRRGQKP